MLFDYKAVSVEGRMTYGRLDAINLVDLEMRLKRMNLDLVTGTPIQHRALFGNRSVPRPELINFCFHLEQLTRAGVPILEGLTDLRDSVEHPRFREVMAGLIESIEGGLTLSQAMAEHPDVFSQVFGNLIRAGESSGQLPDVLASLSESLKWEDELASQTKKLLMYPAFVATIVLSATFFLMIYMVPQLKLFVKNMGHVLPPHTKLLFFVSDLLVDFWYVFLLLPIITVIVGQLILRGNPLARLRLDGIKLRLPVVGPILKKIILSRFASTFAMLYASGIPVLESIRSTQNVVGNRVVRRALERVEQSIREGQNVAGAFRDVGLFPPLVVRMLRIGESTGGLDKALINVSYFYNRDVRESVGKAQALIEPMLTLFMGALLGWIMLSVIGPIYDVISKIKT
ncbi:type II secretion system F family protein [Ferribacterium limneticum]|uniref:type II secretion system F family protein n=1 Tax=Ferribacterium limneticum TaxID=76259 RepID=UPI001CFBA154|nr:type II secretion system F family protein [Ferribacterium limneticum]UCV29237.1 type II secretion system F family protein [Ferribacterium limneticum]UCV33156.1 type II secretion system F family protein [Ferribacterium limneticum]